MLHIMLLSVQLVTGSAGNAKYGTGHTGTRHRCKGDEDVEREDEGVSGGDVGMVSVCGRKSRARSWVWAQMRRMGAGAGRTAGRRRGRTGALARGAGTRKAPMRGTCVPHVRRAGQAQGCGGRTGAGTGARGGGGSRGGGGCDGCDRSKARAWARWRWRRACERWHPRGWRKAACAGALWTATVAGAGAMRAVRDARHGGRGAGVDPGRGLRALAVRHRRCRMWAQTQRARGCRGADWRRACERWHARGWREAVCVGALQTAVVAGAGATGAMHNGHRGGRGAGADTGGGSRVLAGCGRHRRTPDVAAYPGASTARRWTWALAARGRCWRVPDVRQCASAARTMRAAGATCATEGGGAMSAAGWHVATGQRWGGGATASDCEGLGVLPRHALPPHLSRCVAKLRWWWGRDGGGGDKGDKGDVVGVEECLGLPKTEGMWHGADSHDLGAIPLFPDGRWATSLSRTTTVCSVMATLPLLLVHDRCRTLHGVHNADAIVLYGIIWLIFLEFNELESDNDSGLEDNKSKVGLDDANMEDDSVLEPANLMARLLAPVGSVGSYLHLGLVLVESLDPGEVNIPDPEELGQGKRCKTANTCYKDFGMH
ncbi:hypothetical protein DENSPDRAFT_853745 [Dentipellis sp. KUC8613]|nr:hypothetical protein DENSPDRAFT_853745 [Dentipellis sp. KUC8613]